NSEAQNIAYWDIKEQRWNQMGSGTDKSVTNIVARNDSVFVSGGFQRAGMNYSSNFALWLPKNTVNVEEYFSDYSSDIVVYPNPASTTLTLYSPQPEKTIHTIVITDNMGREMTRIDCHISPDSQLLHTVDIQSYSSGLYFVTIYTEGTHYTLPFSVIH
ncbi:MAG: T9SS type A sorting domain-containing protein, partial [Candidatus Kapaibacterium sp.]